MTQHCGSCCHLGLRPHWKCALGDLTSGNLAQASLVMKGEQPVSTSLNSRLKFSNAQCEGQLTTSQSLKLEADQLQEGLCEKGNLQRQMNWDLKQQQPRSNKSAPRSNWLVERFCTSVKL